MDNSDLINILIQKQDKLMTELNEIKVILAAQHENLALHMKRSDEIEKYVSLLEQDMKPMQKHVFFIEGFIKIIGGLAAVVSFIIGVYKLYTMIF